MARHQRRHSPTDLPKWLARAARSFGESFKNLQKEQRKLVCKWNLLGLRVQSEWAMAARDCWDECINRFASARAHALYIYHPKTHSTFKTQETERCVTPGAFVRAYLRADACVKPTCSDCTLRGDHVPGKLVATPVIAANSISGASPTKHSSQSAATSARPQLTSPLH